MKPYSFNIRVQYFDTDKMMGLHHANYMRYFETARTEYFREEGFPYSEMEKEDFQIPVLGVEVKFNDPAVYDEVVAVSCRLVKLGPASLEVDYEVRNAETGALHATGHSRHGFTNHDLRPIPLKKRLPEIYEFIERLYERDKDL